MAEQNADAAESARRFGITVIAIRHGRDMIASPCADDLVQAGDVLIVVGKNDRLTKLESKHLQD